MGSLMVEQELPLDWSVSVGQGTYGSENYWKLLLAYVQVHGTLYVVFAPTYYNTVGHSV